MTPGKKSLLVLARAGMEISWRYAWAGFLTYLACRQIFSLADAASAFVLAFILNHLAAGKTWRRYQSLLLESAGFVLMLLLMFHRLWYETLPFFSFDWLSALFRDTTNLSRSFTSFLMLLCLLLIWRGGRKLVTHAMDYDAVCIQFDKGIGLFILLLLVKFLLLEKAGIPVDGPALGFLVCAFFIFSLLSIFLSRKQPDVEKSFMTGYRVIGVIMSLSTLAVLFGSGAILFFYPVLTRVADSSLVILKDVTEPLVPYLLTIILFLFSPGRIRLGTQPESRDPELPNDLAHTPVSGWVAALLNAVAVGLLVIAGIVALVLLGVFIRRLLRLLAARKTNGRVGGVSLAWILALAGRIPLWLRRVRRILVSLLKGAENAARVYAGLLRWGRRSGLRLDPGETPVEYGKRLALHFPHLRQEIELIVEGFNREIYGQKATSRTVLERLLSALGRLRRPRHWPARIRVCFFHPN